MASFTVENYVKAIYQICASAERGGDGQVAEALEVSPGTVTSMLKTLSEGGLATYTPYEGVKLTEAGTSLALRVLRRHRLIELFLANTLKLSWDEVHDEAENMEHAVSDLLVDRIDEFLGHPEVDPHGDPIPRRDGSVEPTPDRTLAEWQVGVPFRLARVVDQSSEFLRFLSDRGLVLGSEGRLLMRQSQAGTVTLSIDGEEFTLALEAAAKILVTERG